MSRFIPSKRILMEVQLQTITAHSPSQMYRLSSYPYIFGSYGNPMVAIATPFPNSVHHLALSIFGWKTLTHTHPALSEGTKLSTTAHIFHFKSLNDNSGPMQSQSILPTRACLTTILVTTGPLFAPARCLTVSI